MERVSSPNAEDDGRDFFSSTPSQSSRSLPHSQQLFLGGESDEEDDNNEKTLDAPDAPERKRRRIDDDTTTGAVLHPPPITRSASDVSASSSVQAGEWDRRYIGNFVISAWSLSKGPNYIQPGDRILIQRQKPKAPTVTTPQKPAAKGTMKKQTKLSFGATSQANSKKTKVKEDYVVRFSNVRGFEVGRVPSDVSVWMSKVMDLDAASFEGTVVDCPPSLTVGCDLLLDIRAYILRSAFQSTDIPSAITKSDEVSWGSETAESDEEKGLRERKSSLVRLFRACTLRPSVSNSVLSRRGSTEDTEDEDKHDDYPAPENGPSNGKANGSSLIKEDDRRSSTPEVDDGTEMSENQLDSVYTRVQRQDAQLPEVEAAQGFALTLRPYQKQALGWMIKMEQRPNARNKHSSRDDNTAERSLHPLWEEYLFPVDEMRMDLLDSATNKFYFKWVSTLQ